MTQTNPDSEFVNAIKNQPFFNRETWRLSQTFGVSNSLIAEPAGRRVYFGGPNLENFGDSNVEGIVIAGVARFTTEVQIYFAACVQTDIDLFAQRLETMRRLSGTNPSFYSNSNNNVRVVLSLDQQRFFLFNKNNWQSADFDIQHLQPSFDIDQLLYAVYPPDIERSNSLSAGEFIRWLFDNFGQERVKEITVWNDDDAITSAMQRLPSSILLSELQEGISNQGLLFSDELLGRYHVALNHLPHKHFVILTGVSGTGKTSLAIAYSHAVHGIAEKYADDPFLFICPVRPEWTDPTGLLGYHDILSGEYVVPNFLQAVFRAYNHPSSPVFVCLDEMNLARVEYYLSDVLSAMETKGHLHLHNRSVPLPGSNGLQIPNSLRYPPNMYLIGTINVDETTLPLSDKVLDRAVVVDMTQINVSAFLNKLQEIDPLLTGSIEQCRDLLEKIYMLLEPHRLQFGNRLIEEFVRYHQFAVAKTGVSSAQACDAQLAQKVLVRLRGDGRQRQMLMNMQQYFQVQQYHKSEQIVTGLLDQLNAFGAFEYAR